MGERFTDRLNTAVERSREESARLGHNYVGTEHLLLAILKSGRGKATDLLVDLGLDLETLTQSIDDTVLSSGRSRPPADVPFTPKAGQTLEVAADEARQRNLQSADIEHLLLALARDEDGVAAQVLSSFGVDYASIRGKIDPDR